MLLRRCCRTAASNGRTRVSCGPFVGITSSMPQPAGYAFRTPQKRLLRSTRCATAPEESAAGIADEGAGSNGPPPGVLYDSDFGFERRHELEKHKAVEEAAKDVIHLTCTRNDIAKWRKDGEQLVVVDLRDRTELEYDPPLEAKSLTRALKLDEEVWREFAGISSLETAERVVVYSNPDELKECTDAVRSLLSYDVKSVRYFLGGAREWNKYNNDNHQPVKFVELPV